MLNTGTDEEENNVPNGLDGVVPGGPATTPWPVWQYIHQTNTITVEARETVTVPAGTFEAFRIKRVLEETNNPLSASGRTFTGTQYWWFAGGIGIVQCQRYEGAPLIKLVSYIVN